MTYRAEKNLLGGIALVVLAIVSLVLVSFHQSSRVRESSEWITHTQEVLIHSEKLMTLVTACETDSRGYVLSGQPHFLETSNAARAAMYVEYETLKKLTADNPPQQQRLDSLKQYIDQRIGFTDSVISAHGRGGLLEAANLVASNRGKRFMDTVKQVIGNIQLNENELLNERKEENARYLRNFGLLAFCFLLFVSVSIIILIYNARVNLRRVRMSEETLRYNASLISNISDAVITTDPSFRIISWNKHAEALFGWTEAEVKGRPTSEFIKSGLSDELREKRRQQILNEGFVHGEMSLYRKNGEPVSALLSTSIMKDDKGAISGTITVLRDISELKSMEAQLIEFNRNLEGQVKTKSQELVDAFERISDGFISLDKNWNIKFINTKAGEVISRDPHTIVGKNFWEELPDVIGTPFYHAYHRAMETQEKVRMEDYYAPYQKWFENLLYPSPDGLSVYFQDITSRKQYELNLAQNEEIKRLIMNAALDAIVTLNTKGEVISWNPQAERFFGWKEEEVVGKRITDRIIPERYPFLREEGLKRYVQTGQGAILNRLIELSAYNRHGDEFPIELAITPIKQNGSEFFCAFIRDITDRKRVEESMRNSEQKYKLLFMKNPLPMWMISVPDRNFIDVNEAAIAHYGYTREEFLSMNGKDIRPAEDVEKYVTDMNRRPEGTYHAGIWRHVKKDGSLIRVEIITHDIVYEDKPVRLILANDVTDKEIAKEQLQESRDQLRQLASHMEEVREEERIHIAREIHDELGQQLTGIKMDVAWISRKLTTEDEGTRQKIKAVLGLLDGAVKTVRKISSELRPSLLDDLGLAAAMEWHGEEFGRRSGLKVDLIAPDSHPELPSNIATGIFRIYQESLTNVARHAQATDVIANLQFVENQVSLTVTDNGQGFDPSTIGAKKTLGLLGITERTLMMNGEYDIISSPGKGTTVSITVPL